MDILRTLILHMGIMETERAQEQARRDMEAGQKYRLAQEILFNEFLMQKTSPEVSQ